LAQDGTADDPAARQGRLEAAGGDEGVVTALEGKRILVTQWEDFMGPAICRFLAARGAAVVADASVLRAPEAARKAVEAAGPIDALVINLALPAPSTRLADVDEAEWREAFEIMVDPLPRLVRAAVPGMKQRGGGRIVVMGSASALRGMKRASTYSAARGAQLAYVQAAGVELAPDNIQINAIAQNFVDNATYFPPEVQADPRFQDRLKREVPLGRLVSAEEDASLVAYLCSEAARCFVGQVFPLSGGWAVR
jgi:2-keto-3-deoxy-L-fuconate dehydrogenase